MCMQVGNKDVLNCYYAHAEDSLQVLPASEKQCSLFSTYQCMQSTHSVI